MSHLHYEISRVEEKRDVHTCIYLRDFLFSAQNELALDFIPKRALLRDSLCRWDLELTGFDLVVHERLN